MNIRELSPELAKIARDELGEDPARIAQDLQAIKDWLAKQNHINARTDDQWLIAFLRGCKYSLERTKEKIDNFYTMKTMIPEITQAFDINDPKYKNISKIGGNFVLTKPCSPDGPRVVVVRPGRYDISKYALLDSLRYSNMLSDLLLLEDDNTTVAGQMIIIDLKDVGVGHLSHMTPANVKKIILTGQDSLPVRQKGTHHIHTPGGVEAVFSLMKVFLNEKNKQRIILHNDDLESLQKYIPKEILPTEYGGDGGPIDDMIEYWNKRLENRSEWFRESAQFCTDENKRAGKPRTAESLFGIQGSFRKLNVD